MNRCFSPAEIQELYRQHPLQDKRILARILVERETLDGITEQDLAEDPSTEITDQNHVGGTKFVAELARRSGIGSSTRVLDIGSGLGGSARYLAYCYGCRVHGIDLSPERCAQAESLTRLAGLQNLVTFEAGDARELPLPATQFDVLWDQGSWVHFPDIRAFLRKWASSLRIGGYIAIEDAYLKRASDSSLEIELLTTLEQSWMSCLESQAVWIDGLTGAGFSIETVEELSPALREHSVKLIGIHAQASTNDVSEAERAGWHHTIQLTDAGVLGYFRILARK